jgi:hypothetical protein
MGTFVVVQVHVLASTFSCPEQVQPRSGAERQHLTRRFFHPIENVHVSIDQSVEERATSPIDHP